MRTHQIREALRDGRPTIGCFMSLGSPSAAEILGHAGFEWLVIETEHTGLDAAEIQQLVTAVDATPAVPFVRVHSIDKVAIQRALDIGAMGIVVPLVRTAEEAVAIVDATRFPPQGNRSFGPVRAARYGLDNVDYFNRANEQIVVILILETQEALNNLPAIASVEGIDALYIGPFDLSLSLGLDPMSASAPELERAIQSALETCSAHRLALGVPVRTPEELRRRRAEGFSFFGFGPDYLLLGDAARAGLEAFAEAPEHGRQPEQ
jgi:4-hydroxy-2-oxoheptanedioate aldolase